MVPIRSFPLPRNRRRPRLAAAGALVFAMVASVLAVVAPATAAAAPVQTTAAKGPVGWEAYRSMDSLARMRPGEQVKQFSSFDRTGGNDDGFEGTYSCLRNTPDGQCVIAEAAGAGEISSMWFTYQPDSVAPIGAITVELDGRVILQGSLQDIVSGAEGAPFVWPLVGNSTDTMGGAVIKVPMPYTSSMRVTTQNNPHFYHVTYRQFADADGVRTFDPSDPAMDVVNRLRGYGVRDPKPPVPGETTQSAAVELAPGATMSLPLAGGPRQISELELRLPQAVTGPTIYDDGRAYNPGGSSFDVAVAENNEGVRLTRRYDPKIGDQRATVSVDGQQVGEWRSGPATPPGVWADQAIEIPASLTAGKARLHVENTFVSSSLDVNEFRYDVHSKIGGEWVRTDVLDLGPNHPHAEAAHNYRIDGMRWSGLGTFRYPSEPDQVAASDAILENLRLRVTFDGQTTVDTPVGEFFGSGLGKYNARTLTHAIDTTEGGAFTSWWPMPYASDAVVQLVNGSGVPVTGASLSVTSAPDPTLPAELAPSGSLGYFHATYHRADTVEGQEWQFLAAQVQGVFYGVSTTMRGKIPPGDIPQMNYLEGDERVYVDGSRSPSLIGTGSEDFYESGWYFQDADAGGATGVPYAMPLAGMVGHENSADGCPQVCLGAYRLLVSDAVPFGSSIEFDIEHGPNSNRNANYSSTAYWYGKPTKTVVQSDLMDAADDRSRAQHGYRAEGETRSTLTSTFEGRLDTRPVTAGTTTATGPVEFTATVNEDNNGLRLHRTSDQARPAQRANVFIDGRYVGEWYQPLANTHSRWLEDTFDVPAAMTEGKAAVTVRLEPIAGAPPWSASRYRVLSHVDDGGTAVGQATRS